MNRFRVDQGRLTLRSTSKGAAEIVCRIGPDKEPDSSTVFVAELVADGKKTDLQTLRPFRANAKDLAFLIRLGNRLLARERKLEPCSH